MGVQAQKSGRRARKRAVVGDGLIAQLERDKDSDSSSRQKLRIARSIITQRLL